MEDASERISIPSFFWPLYCANELVDLLFSKALLTPVSPLWGGDRRAALSRLEDLFSLLFLITTEDKFCYEIFLEMKTIGMQESIFDHLLSN